MGSGLWVLLGSLGSDGKDGDEQSDLWSDWNGEVGDERMTWRRD